MHKSPYSYERKCRVLTTGIYVRATARGGGGSNSGVKAQSMPAQSARAALCCAGAKPAACGIAKLEYGNPLDL
eukprot:6201969-Pleurochrysis_carterae.AAC.3